MKKHSSCVVGDQCSLFTKAIGLTINDILRNQVLPNVPFGKQSSLIQVGAAITMIMFVGGLINGILSLITFKNKKLREIGCGVYLFASSVTSLLTITMFTVKFWLVVLIQMYASTSSFLLRADCVAFGPLLKLCLYFDGWLNACVGIERTVSVSKGVSFNKRKSKCVARWIIIFSLVFVMGTVIHEPFHHYLFHHATYKYRPLYNNFRMNIPMENDTIHQEREKNQSYAYETEHHVLCVIRYTRSLQTYNTITLFFHLLAPFIGNLCSALYIILGTARQRSAAKTKQTFQQHVLKQISEHKQLLISPIILLVLALPRLIISLVSGCVDPSSSPWLYFCGYLISFTPPMLIFVVFVIPSELYTKTFKESVTRWLRRIRR